MLLPFLFLISASFLLPGYSKVSSGFNKCSGFFFKEKFPNNALEPQNPAWICQRYKYKYFFATMYDRTKRIPIYSAYVYNPKSAPRSEDWMIEPQLANSRYGPDMEDERETTIPVAEIEASQATFNDYKAAPSYIDKGHLNPVGHQPDEVSKAATSTLTNIVPQSRELNQKEWKKYEMETMAKKNKNLKCTKTYIITGVVPGTDLIAGRVNYPSHIWSAACCVTDKNESKSWGAIADNNWKATPKVTERTLQELEEDLTKLYNKKVDLFGSSCY